MFAAAYFSGSFEIVMETERSLSAVIPATYPFENQ